MEQGSKILVSSETAKILSFDQSFVYIWSQILALRLQRHLVNNATLSFKKRIISTLIILLYCIKQTAFTRP